MSKYQELVESAEKTTKLFNNLKARISGDFVSKLSQDMDCEKDRIGVEFGKPKYSERNKILTWDFTLFISIVTNEGNIRFPLHNFSLAFIKDTENVSSVTVRYKDKMCNLNESLDGLSDLVFQEIQKNIEQGSWF